MKKLALLTVCLSLVSFSSNAEEINLTADKQVELHQKENKMVAIGNAVASKKDMSIRADKMTAFYEKTKNKSQISSVFAEGGVVMTSPKAKAYGNTLDYDVKEDRAVLIGNPAKIKSEKETLSASKSIVYYPSKHMAEAEGEVIIDNGENKVYSNKLISYFETNKSGALEMERVEIFDNVKIVSKDATVTALRGVYLPKTGIVKLFDNVVIEQNGNFLKGDIAESNLNTGISRLLSSSQSGGRVSGVFKEKEKTNDKK